MAIIEIQNYRCSLTVSHTDRLLMIRAFVGRTGIEIKFAETERETQAICELDPRSSVKSSRFY